MPRKRLVPINFWAGPGLWKLTEWEYQRYLQCERKPVEAEMAKELKKENNNPPRRPYKKYPVSPIYQKKTR